ncbi:hypothetical protein ACF08M_31080 [Streptomyces sp. NPDC015032]|uniref:hypothetical protein n=1 Tax=Streptomyces sp. NPDC015032 TaxID=3364937 RepID=UPI0037023602
MEEISSGGSALHNPRKKAERGPADGHEVVPAGQQQAAQRRAAARWTEAGPEGLRGECGGVLMRRR